MLKSLEERQNDEEKHRFYEPMGKMTQNVRNEDREDEKYVAEVEDNFKAHAGDILEQIRLSHLRKNGADEANKLK